MGPNRWRLVGSALGVAALSVAIFISPTVGGLAMGAVVALGCFAIGERLFRRFATKEQIRADLEDRVRNPPA